MTAKRILQSVVALALLAATLASAGGVSAWSGCAGYITVQSGDTLGGIAAACGTTVDAIRAANPGMGWSLYAGQVIHMPTGGAPAPTYYPGQPGGSTYVVQVGDTLGGIAFMYGVSLTNLLSVNPQIGNPSLIYPGQVINLPAGASTVPGTYNPYPPYNPSYYPTPYPTYYPTPVPSSPFGNLKVIAGHGLLVRSGPGINNSEIKSQYVSAVKYSTWQYRKSSLTTDSIGFVWVEITLSPRVSGYSTGWILVRDSLGNYFTDPNLGPKIDPNDP